MKKLLYNIDLYPDELLHYPNCAILINDGKVEQIIKDYEGLIDQYVSINLNGSIVLPGFIDVHTHGGYGYDFLKNPDQAEQEYSRGCVKEGCTAYLASFVSEDHQYLLDSLSYYTENKSNGYGQCLGIHLEGPFLNNKYLAVMRPGSLRNPSLEEMKELVAAGKGHIVDMTIAPELEGAYDIMDFAKEHGINIMLGHSDASIEDAKAAITHNAKGITHLYNAMSPHHHRNPGLVTAGFLYKELICELITDGFHVDPDVIRVTYNTVKPERIAIVTDASLIKGLADGTYEFSSQIVNKKGIKATVASTGRIAGSVVGMDDCVRKMVHFTDCSLNEIVQMASINPSKIANVENTKGKLLAGYDADLVCLSNDLQVLATFVGGVKVYG